MKKKIFSFVLVLILLLGLTGCNEENKVNNNSSSGSNNSSNNKLDHKVYKYIKACSSNGSDLIVPIEYIFGSIGTVGYGDKSYDPCLFATIDTNTGRATDVKFYAYFLDNDDNEWVNKAVEKYNESSDSYKKDFTNVSKGRVNSGVSYLVVSVNPDSYSYDQYMDYLIKHQDIEEYKKRVYYDQLYNYSTTPEVKDENEYFWDALSGKHVYYSDSEFSAY